MAKKTQTSKKKGSAKGPSRPPAKASKPKPAESTRSQRHVAKPKSAKPKPSEKPSKPAKKPDQKAPAKPAPKAQTPPTSDGRSNVSKSGRKGITIVSPKPKKKAKPERPAVSVAALAGQLLAPGTKRKPLIPSGPKAPVRTALDVSEGGKGTKSPFNKRELMRFRQILIGKRAELVGDVSTMESEALKGHGGDLSHTPQHMAEQGTDTYEQTLSLDLAAADRKLIREIEDALKRIDTGTYGICELTGKPIRVERLEELPWTRYSIEAARELERRSYRV